MFIYILVFMLVYIILFMSVHLFKENIYLLIDMLIYMPANKLHLYTPNLCDYPIIPLMPVYSCVTCYL